MNRTALTSTLLVSIILFCADMALAESLPPLIDVEQQAMSDTLQHALEYNRTNQTADWVNPDSARSGIVVPVRTFVGDQGQPCREFVTTITSDGKQQQGYGTACRQSNGVWYVVGDGSPSWVTVVPRQPVYAYQPPERYYVPPTTYYSPYPINFSFSLGYMFNGGSLHVGNYYSNGPIWYPRNIWRQNRYRYYRPSSYSPHYRPYYRSHQRSHYRR